MAATAGVSLATSSSSSDGGASRVGKYDDEDSVESHYRLRSDNTPLKRIEGEQLGQTFFFCDMRRAVIIVNLITIASSIAFFVILLVSRASAEQIQQDFTDDQVQDMAEHWSKLDDIGYVYQVFLRVVCAALGVGGGIWFNGILTSISALSLLFDFAMGMLRFDLIGLFIAPIFLFPHLMFLKYLHSGLMSPQNYDKEMQSCCCV